MVRDLPRRKVVKTAGIATFGSISVTGTTSAEGSVREQINIAQINGNFKKAEEIANDHGISYNWSSENVTKTTEDDVRIQNRWDEHQNDSTIYISVVEGGMKPGFENADYSVHAFWELSEKEGIGRSVDKTCPPDGSAIFWNDDHFTQHESGSSGVSAHHDRISYDQMSNNGGFLVEVNDPSVKNDFKEESFSAGWATCLDSISSSPEDHPIRHQYQHTYINAAKQTCFGVTPTLGFGAGGIEVDGEVAGWHDSVDTRVRD